MQFKRIWILTVVFAVLSCNLAAADDLRRKHADGPLTAEDFQADIPADGANLDAIVYTQLGFAYEFHGKKVDGKFRLTCTSAICSAEQVPAKSWIRSAQAARINIVELLDHEQGHFDLALLMSKKAQARLRHLTRAKRLVGVGADLAAAEADLKKKIAAQISPFERQLLVVHAEYDRTTKHGQLKAAQKKARREQKEKIRVNRTLSR